MKAKLERLLRRALSERQGVVVIGDDASISELFVSARPRISFLDGWLTCETPRWHVHTRLADLARVRFVEEPSSCLNGKMSYHLAFETRRGKPLVRVYLTRKMARYKDLKARFSGLSAGRGRT